MKRLSIIALYLILLPVVFYIIFHGNPFMEPINRKILEDGPGKIIIFALIAVFLVVTPHILKTVFGGMKDLLQMVKSVTDHGVEGWAEVKKIYSTGEILGANTLYFMDLDVEDQLGERYSITVLHPVRRKDLGYFIPGSRIPVKSAAGDHSKIIFLQLSYARLRSFLFYDENSDDWKRALQTKEEISLSLADTEE